MGEAPLILLIPFVGDEGETKGELPAAGHGCRYCEEMCSNIKTTKGIF